MNEDSVHLTPTSPSQFILQVMSSKISFIMSMKMIPNSIFVSYCQILPTIVKYFILLLSTIATIFSCCAKLSTNTNYCQYLSSIVNYYLLLVGSVNINHEDHLLEHGLLLLVPRDHLHRDLFLFRSSFRSKRFLPEGLGRQGTPDKKPF